MLCWFLPYINMNQPEVYICPLPFILPPTSPKPGCHGAPSLSSLHHTANFHLLSILHTVVCMFPCCSLDPSHPLLPALCPPVCSLCLRLHMLSPFSHVRLTATLWTMACQAPLSMRFSRQEYQSGLPFPSPATSPLLPCKWVHQYHLSRFQTYALIYRSFLFLIYFTLYNSLQVHPPHQN